jgi:hypothetical protein
MRGFAVMAGSLTMLTLGALAFAQWQEVPQNDQRVGPVYPRKPYSFEQGNSSNYPYRFDWSRGAWSPVPYGTGAPGGGYQYTYVNGTWQYAPVAPNTPMTSSYVPNPSANGGAPNANAPSTASPSASASPSANASASQTPDDTSLWMDPTTLPASTQPTVQFSGRIFNIKAVELDGEQSPHILLRLHNVNGAKGTVDVGERLEIPQTPSSVLTDGQITVIGEMGDINGSPVLFANQVVFGRTTVTIDR